MSCNAPRKTGIARTSPTLVSKVMRMTIPVLAAAALWAAAPAAKAWEPTKPIEFVVPAGTGGGADQMARFLQGVVAKHSLSKQPIVVVNRSGGAGAEGFLDVKNDKGNGHKIVITLSNLFTTPLATGVPFNWRDLTPVQMLALDQFVLWVNAESPHQTAKAYLDAVKAGPDRAMKMAGTGSKQEDQIITVMVEKVAGKKITYIPGAPASCGRCACSTASPCRTAPSSRPPWPGRTSPPAPALACPPST